MLPPTPGAILMQVKNGLLVLAVPVVPAAAVLPAVAVAKAMAFAASGLLAGFLARLRVLGKRGRAEREGGGRAGADEEGTNCFHLELLGCGWEMQWM